HGALMTGGFLGTLISLERAIALGEPAAYAAPLAAGSGAMLLLVGQRDAGLWISLGAPMALAIVSASLLRRQAQAHIVVLLVAALAWGVGDALNAAGALPNAVAAWWFSFLVLTIAAERLEMTRLTRRPAVAAPLFHACVGTVLAGAALSLRAPAAGGVVFGAGLAALAAWLAAFDIARRTVAAEGFARYSAVALLAGYAWLAAGGAAWCAMAAAGPAWRDAALHALGLGFVFSMILAHAPVVVPVVARRRMRYTPWMYAPLALLHASLVVRMAGDAGQSPWRAWGGILNALAILAFAGTLAFALSRKMTNGIPTTTAEEPRR
ncbi:MAG TPA: hypothetical protein VFO24_06125, partial [Usitatibacter sp.]|nr:hypothetical protein [Usitatibacter sp.]